jgi:hypothetical protein
MSAVERGPSWAFGGLLLAEESAWRAWLRKAAPKPAPSS